MNIDEADAIIAELNVCFPHAKITKEVVKRWEENLGPYHYQDGRAAVRAIEQTCDFWPSWAKFLTVIRPMHQRRLLDEQQQQRLMEQRQLEPSPEDMERTKAIIAEIRRNFVKRMTARDT